ncbi:TetR/AcrR family transcriptional regulator [Bacillaceae bacterium]
MDKKEIQTMRMMRYFIDATVQIIKEEGIENVTIRKIADLAGYNSATIYNYFQEVSHLIFFAAMTFLKRYTDALPAYIARGKTPLERFLLIWECFCKFSFEEPKIYQAIFASNLGDHPENLLKNYYTIFPTDIMNLPEELLPMVLESNLSERSKIALRKCVEEGYIKKENVDEIVELTNLIWHGMLSLLLNYRTHYTPEEAAKVTMKYIRQIVLNANHFEFGM